MRTGIHGAIEFRPANGLPWQAEKEFTAELDLGRNYALFALLGNVRKESQDVLADEHSPTWITLREFLEFDWTQMATHCGVINAVEFEKWDRRKRWIPSPDSYSSNIDGPNVTHVDNDAMRAIVKNIVDNRRGTAWAASIDKLRELFGNTYTRVCWQTSYARDGRAVWEYILPVMLPLGKQHGYDNVRIVMDFDS